MKLIGTILIILANFGLLHAASAQTAKKDPFGFETCSKEKNYLESDYADFLKTVRSIDPPEESKPKPHGAMEWLGRALGNAWDGLGKFLTAIASGCNGSLARQRKPFYLENFDLACFSYPPNSQFKPEEHFYTHCENGKRANGNQGKPCVTQAMAEVTSESFRIAKDCGVIPANDVEHMVWLFGQESGYFPNIESKSESGGAVGVAQLQDGAIHDLLQSDSLKKLKNKIEQNTDPKLRQECRLLKNTINQQIKDIYGSSLKPDQEKAMIQNKSRTACERTKIPPHPLLGIVQGYQYFISRAGSARGLVDELQKNTWIKLNIGDIQEQMYNTGSGLISESYLMAAKTCTETKMKTKECFNAQLNKVLKKYYYKEFLPKHKKNEKIARKQLKKETEDATAKAIAKVNEIFNYPGKTKNLCLDTRSAAKRKETQCGTQSCP